MVILVQATRDADAYGELARRHQASLRAFLWRLTADAGRAEDLAQDALLAGYRNVDRFEGAASFRTWLFAIAYRGFLQGRRKAGVISRLIEAVKREPAPAAAAQADMSLDIQRALARLEPKERAALLLCDACGMSHSEASEAMAAPLGSVKTYVQRARDKMRAAMTPAGEETPDGE